MWLMQSPTAEDADALRQIAAGDQEMFSRFYRQHLNAVLAYFMRRVGDRELALDLTAETFAAVVVGAANHDGQGPPVAWLFGIARNKLRESLRRNRVADAARRRLQLEPLVIEDAALALVEERAGEGEGQLERALGQLPEEIRAALLARVVEEEDYREIAARLDCSEQLVRQRVHRGLQRLRAEISEGS